MLGSMWFFEGDPIDISGQNSDKNKNLTPERQYSEFATKSEP